MKIAWLTDIHLNFLKNPQRKNFYDEIKESCAESVFITGDIAEAPSVAQLLVEMADAIKMRIYFVLGNHDYYHGSISEVWKNVEDIRSNQYLTYLSHRTFERIGNAIITGVDSWADGRFGNFNKSWVRLNDSALIEDLYKEELLSKNHLLTKMQKLADNEANALHRLLNDAIKHKPKRIIILTHIPPFKETCKHEGKISDDNWLPFFSSKVMGDMLLECAKNNPTIDFLTLCGHTHSPAYYKPLDNLIVKAGTAKYGNPTIQEIITI